MIRTILRPDDMKVKQFITVLQGKIYQETTAPSKIAPLDALARNSEPSISTGISSTYFIVGKNFILSISLKNIIIAASRDFSSRLAFRRR